MCSAVFICYVFDHIQVQVKNGLKEYVLLKSEGVVTEITSLDKLGSQILLDFWLIVLYFMMPLSLNLLSKLPYFFLQ